MSIMRRIAGITLLIGGAALASCKETAVQVVEVATVEITGAPGTLLVGGTVQLAAVPKDDRNNVLSGRETTWTSSAPAVASVDGSGRVTGLTAGTATISASVEGRSASVTLTVNNPAPTLNALDPAEAAVGGPGFELTVRGTNFVHGSVVLWDGHARATTYVSGTELRAQITAADIAQPRVVQVAVSNPAPGGGTSASRPFTVTAAANPVPAITALDPSRTAAGSGALTLTVRGTNFVQGSVVRWNGSNRQTTYVSATELRAQIPAGDLAQPGQAQVTVFNPAPGGGASNALTFTIEQPVNPAPTITALDPSSAFAGSDALTLKVTGTNFVQSSVVRWNGSDRQTTYVSATELRAEITAADLAEPGTAQVTVFNPAPGGGTSNAQPFAILTPPGAIVPRMSAGFYHTCGVSTTGTVYCWGLGEEGRLGNGTSENSAVPVAVAGGQVYAQVAAGDHHSCGITTTGQAFCWGFNVHGQLGDGGVASSEVPVAVSGGHSFKAIDVGIGFSCGLTTGGAIYCWGSNTDGNLGDGTTTNRRTPVPVAGGHTFAKLAVGGFHACGVTLDGKALCWGRNTNGQLGDGTTTNRSTPTAVAGGQRFVDITAGTVHTCAITSDGSAFCWGRNESGELGDGTFVNRTTPVAVSGGHAWRVVLAGGNVTCGVAASGAAYCWGVNDFGQLGNSAAIRSSQPVPVQGGVAFEYVVPGLYHTCGVATNGQALCWGGRGYGQLGTGNTVYEGVPVPVAGGHSFAEVDAGSFHTCGVTTGGVGYCWGYGVDGRLGTGSTNILAWVPASVTGGRTFSTISAGGTHSCGLDAEGLAYCWGTNAQGQLGNGTTTMSATPVAVSGGLRFTMISAGELHTCGVTVQGDVYCWGGNTVGQSGVGSLQNQLQPVRVNLGPGIVATHVAAGLRHTCARTSAGGVYCWGLNSSGQLGNGGFASSATPQLVAGSHSFATVVAGDWHSCGVLTNGSVRCWGNGLFGKLGNNTLFDVPTPQLVQGLPTAKEVVAGGEHSCALTTDDRVYCWGRGFEGQLGAGTAGVGLTPVLVAGGLHFAQITAGYVRTCGVTSTGAAYCWGWQDFGELGNNGVTIDVTPQPVAGGIVFGSTAAMIVTCAQDVGGAGPCARGRGAGAAGARLELGRPGLVRGPAARGLEPAGRLACPGGSRAILECVGVRPEGASALGPFRIRGVNPEIPRRR